MSVGSPYASSVTTRMPSVHPFSRYLREPSVPEAHRHGHGAPPGPPPPRRSTFPRSGRVITLSSGTTRTFGCSPATMWISVNCPGMKPAPGGTETWTRYVPSRGIHVLAQDPHGALRHRVAHAQKDALAHRHAADLPGGHPCGDHEPVQIHHLGELRGGVHVLPHLGVQVEHRSRERRRDVHVREAGFGVGEVGPGGVPCRLGLQVGLLGRAVGLHKHLLTLERLARPRPRRSGPAPPPPGPCGRPGGRGPCPSSTRRPSTASTSETTPSTNGVMTAPAAGWPSRAGEGSTVPYAVTVRRSVARADRCPRAPPRSASPPPPLPPPRRSQTMSEHGHHDDGEQQPGGLSTTDHRAPPFECASRCGASRVHFSMSSGVCIASSSAPDGGLRPGEGVQCGPAPWRRPRPGGPGDRDVRSHPRRRRPAPWLPDAREPRATYPPPGPARRRLAPTPPRPPPPPAPGTGAPGIAPPPPRAGPPPRRWAPGSDSGGAACNDTSSVHLVSV